MFSAGDRTVESRKANQSTLFKLFVQLLAVPSMMTSNSYMMVDPQGRFYQNTDNLYIFSKPILECGVDNALKDVYLDRIKFLKRGGNYAW